MGNAEFRRDPPLNLLALPNISYMLGRYAHKYKLFVRTGRTIDRLLIFAYIGVMDVQINLLIPRCKSIYML